ncbi:MAG: c-type cytochrome [Deltaproteobacteria bacterium]|nr:c-type cytochrome [Deltaproteobacteria bacterium]
MHDPAMSPRLCPVVRSSLIPLALALRLLAPAPVFADPPPSDGSSRAAAGAALYEKYCALCHGATAQGYAADNAPSLVTPQWLSSADDAFMVNSIALGRPDTAMAAYAKQAGGPLSDQEIADVVAFLRSRGPAYVAPQPHAPGSARKGAAIYSSSCASCHGDRSRRADAIHLANQTFLGLASDAFLYDGIARGRDGTPMKAYAGELDPEEIADVVAYLRSWSSGPPPALVRPRGGAAEGPMVVNPDGAAPEFTLRDQTYVPVDEVKRALDEGRRMILVDARVPSDWERERITGAISVPYYETAAVDRIPNDGTWVIAYCACPHHASGEVVTALRRRGYPHTAVLDEGVLVWKQRGYPMSGAAVASSAAGR